MYNQNGIKKVCENCRYYSHHYSKQDLRIVYVFCGHCLHKDVKNYKKKSLELCEKWEDIEIKKEERKKSIKETLVIIAERLNEISIILQDDTKDDNY